MRGAAVTYEPRLGKTRLTINTAERLYRAREITAAIVVAPNGIHLEWTRLQIPAYWPQGPATRVVEWDSRRAHTKAFQGQLDEALKAPGFLWVAVNVEAMWRPRLTGKKASGPLGGFLGRVTRARKTLLVIDESHSIKNPTAKQTRAAIRLAEACPYRRTLTGTPIGQGPFDLWSQYQVVDPSILAQKFTTFKARYGVFKRHRPTECRWCGWPAEHPIKWRGRLRFMECVHCGKEFKVFGPVFDELVEYRNLDELRRRIAPFTFHRVKKDCLDLPERLMVRRYFVLPDEHRRVYEDLRTKLMARLDGGEEVTAPAALTNLLRLQQVTRGYVKTDDGQERGLGDPYPSVEAAVELVRQNPGKSVLWCHFTHDVDALAEACRAAGMDPVICTGETPKGDRPGLRALFNDPASGANPWIGTLGAGGAGVDLGGADLMVFYSHGYDLIKRLQGLERNYGSSQKAQRVEVVDLVAADTADERALAAIERKEDLAESMSGRRLRELLE